MSALGQYPSGVPRLHFRNRSGHSNDAVFSNFDGSEHDRDLSHLCDGSVDNVTVQFALALVAQRTRSPEDQRTRRLCHANEEDRASIGVGRLLHEKQV